MFRLVRRGWNPASARCAKREGQSPTPARLLTRAIAQGPDFATAAEATAVVPGRCPRARREARRGRRRGVRGVFVGRVFCGAWHTTPSLAASAAGSDAGTAQESRQRDEEEASDSSGARGRAESGSGGADSSVWPRGVRAGQTGGAGDGTGEEGGSTSVRARARQCVCLCLVGRWLTTSCPRHTQWHCEECGADNSALRDRCRLCSAPRAASEVDGARLVGQPRRPLVTLTLTLTRIPTHEQSGT